MLDAQDEALGAGDRIGTNGPHAGKVAPSAPRRRRAVALAIVVAGLTVLGALAVSPHSSGAGASPPAQLVATPTVANHPDTSSITVDPTSNSTFDELNVSLSGFGFFDGDGVATVDVYNASVPTFPIDSDPFYYIGPGGSTYGYFPVINGSAGEYTFVATEAGGYYASTTFTLTASGQTVTATPSACGPGYSVLVQSSTFPTGGTTYTIDVGSPSLSYVQLYAGATADSDPAVDTCVTLPHEPTGSYVLFVASGNYYFAATPVSIGPLLPLYFSPSQGVVGSSVTASGSGFADDASVQIYWSAGTACTATTSDSGQYSCPFTVPAVSGAAYTFTAADGLGHLAIGTFTVTAPGLSLTPGQGPIESVLTVTGHGFAVDTTLTSLTFAGISVTSCLSGSLTTGTIAPGGFSCSFRVPAIPAGPGVVIADEPVGPSATTAYVVTVPSVSLSPDQGPAGAYVTISGHGFTVDTPLASLSFGGTAISSCLAGSLTTGSVEPGAFSCSVDVPALSAGLQGVVAVDTSGASPEGTFTVTVPSLSFSPNQGPLSAVVTITGHGFSVDSLVSAITFGGTTISTCLSGSLMTGAIEPGEFACTVRVPLLAPGYATVSANDSGGTVASAEFDVTGVSLTLSVTSGPVGTSVTAIGHGFSVDMPLLEFVFDDVAISSCLVGSLTTGTIAPGGFSCTFDVPSGTIGPDVYAEDVTDNYASATFDVT